MSINSEITRIEKNIKEAYVALEGKGATLPVEKNTNNLVTCISSVPQSGGGEGVKVPYEIPYEITAEKELRKASTAFAWSSGEATSIGNYSFYMAFLGSGLPPTQGGYTWRVTELNFPLVHTIKAAGCQQMYSRTNFGESYLTKVTFPELVHVEQNGMYLFCSDSKITTLSFPKLAIVDYYSLPNAFQMNSLLESVTFNSLDSVGQVAFKYCFNGCKKLKNVYLDGPFSKPFGANPFQGMLSQVDGCIVHLPATKRDLFINLPDVLNGFGGTNTKVIFDLHGATINFVVTNSNDYEIFMDDEKVNNTGMYSLDDKKYTIFDKQNSVIHSGTITGLQAETSYDVNLDMNAAKGSSKKVTVYSDEPGLTVTYFVNGRAVQGAPDGKNGYVLSIDSAEVHDISYKASKEGFNIEEGTISYDGTDKRVKVCLIKGSTNPFVQPILTNDGVLGGPTFACGSEPEAYSDAYAWFAFSEYAGEPSAKFCYINDIPCSYIMYSPKYLDIKSIKVTFDHRYPENSYLYIGRDPSSYKMASDEAFHRTNVNPNEIDYIPNNGNSRGNYFKLVFNDADSFTSGIAVLKVQITANEVNEYKGIKYNIKAPATATIKLGDVILDKSDEIMYRWFEDDQIPDECDLKIEDNGAIIYTGHINFKEYDKLTPIINLDVTKECTVNLTSNDPFKSVVFTVDGIQLSGTSLSSCKAFKGSTVGYHAEFENGFPVDGSLKVIESIEIPIERRTTKVILSVKDEDASYYDWEPSTTVMADGYDFYRSTDKGRYNSSFVMKIIFTGTISFDFYLNNYSDYGSREVSYSSNACDIASTDPFTSKLCSYSSAYINKNPINFPGDYKKVSITRDKDSNPLDPKKTYFIYVKYYKEELEDKSIVAIPRVLEVKQDPNEPAI